MVDSGLNGRSVDILLVEDNPGDVRRLELMLDMTDDPYHLHTAHSIKAACETLAQKKSRIKIILLDLSLPDSNGIETVRALHASYPRIPIIVLTGMDNEQIVAEAATAGAHDYIVKQDLNPANLWRVLRYTVERGLHEEELRISRAAYRQQARELNLLNHILAHASSSNEEQTMLDTVCHELAHFFDAPYTCVILCDDTMASIAAEYSQPAKDALLNKQFSLYENEIFAAVLTTQHALICPHLPKQTQQFFKTPKVSKAILYPLIMEEKAIGFIFLVLPASHALAVSDVRLVAMVTHEVELALTKIRLHGRLQAYANKLEDRVQARTQELAEANEQLKSLDRLKSKFVSDVSHELRNPITNLTLYLELLEFAKQEKRPQYFGILRTQIRRLSNLVEEILTLSRLENNNYRHLYETVDLNHLIQQLIEVHEPRAENKQLEIQFTPATTLPPVWGEPNQLTQVITNLLDNALNYTEEGHIKIKTMLYQAENQPGVMLTVTDSGIGIPEEDLPHVFERFYRGTMINRDAIAGTGLGLGIVHEIVTLHNGRISIDSTLNEGTTFTVCLPTAPPE